MPSYNNILKKIIFRIETEKKIAIFRRKFSFVLPLFLSLTALLVIFWQYFDVDASETGFFQYLSIAFYDFRYLNSRWQDYVVGLLEVMPTISLIELLTILLLLLVFLRLLYKYGKYIFNKSQHTIFNQIK